MSVFDRDPDATGSFKMNSLLPKAESVVSVTSLVKTSSRKVKKPCAAAGQ